MNLTQKFENKEVLKMKHSEFAYISKYINSKDIIFEDEFRNLFFNMFPNRSERYYYYYLMEFYRNNILYKYDTNKLKSCSNRMKFIIDLTIEDRLKHQLMKINPTIDISIWNISLLSNFTLLQIYQDIYIVETYAYAKESVLEVLLDEGKYAIYEEDFFIMKKYNKNSTLYIIKTLNVDSPIVRKKTIAKNSRFEKSSFVTIPKIEKIFVDIFNDNFFKILFSDEINNIYMNLLKNYQINFATVFRYASKKHCYDELINYLDHMGFDVEKGEFR